MNQRKGIIYLILALIPVAFILFLLAMVNVLFLLLGIIALLAGLIVLKKKKPEWFSAGSKPEPPSARPTGRNELRPEQPQVYMVLAGREDFGARRITVNKTSYSIGRGPDNDFVIDGSQISRHHLRIEYNPVEKICYAIDTGSKNGTYINSQRMTEGQRYRLVRGDRVMIDDRSFVVEYAHY